MLLFASWLLKDVWKFWELRPVERELELTDGVRGVEAIQVTISELARRRDVRHVDKKALEESVDVDEGGEARVDRALKFALALLV